MAVMSPFRNSWLLSRDAAKSAMRSGEVATDIVEVVDVERWSIP